MYKPEKKLDIKTEIKRYAKYNYSKKNVIAHLKNDGFTQEEINNNITNQFDKLDKNYFDNIFCYLPSLSVLLITFFYTFSFYPEENDFGKKIFVIATALFLVGIFYAYLKRNKSGVIVSMLIFSVATMYLFFEYYEISQQKHNYFSSSYLLIIALFLIYLIIENYKLYLRKTKTHTN